MSLRCFHLMPPRRSRSFVGIGQGRRLAAGFRDTCSVTTPLPLPSAPTVRAPWAAQPTRDGGSRVRPGGGGSCRRPRDPPEHVAKLLTKVRRPALLAHASHLPSHPAHPAACPCPLLTFSLVCVRVHTDRPASRGQWRMVVAVGLNRDHGAWLRGMNQACAEPGMG